jgi:protein gp37
MADDTGIQWTDHTFNLHWGCTKVGPGCEHCYMFAHMHRLNMDAFTGPDGRRKFWPWENRVRDVMKWQRDAEESGVKARVFCMSMGDLFELLPDDHPDWPEMCRRRDELFTRIVPCTPDLIWQFLTKRIANVKKFVPASWMRGAWPKNVMLGISVVNQAECDRDIPRLLAIPAGQRFLSYEPALGPVNLRPYLRELDWVICGGESDQGKALGRPFELEWARDALAQCQAAGVPFFMKQLGSDLVRRLGIQGDSHGGNMDLWPPDLADLCVREHPR